MNPSAAGTITPITGSALPSLRQNPIAASADPLQVWGSLYRPRLDDIVFKEFLAGAVPSEMREVLRLLDVELSEKSKAFVRRAFNVEPDCSPFFDKVNQIVGTILTSNKLDPAIYTPEVFLSLSSAPDCIVMQREKSKKPLLAIPLRLITSLVQTTDELAASLSRAIAQLVIIEGSNSAGTRTEKRVEVSRAINTSADILAVELIDNAGYNPNALISLARKTTPQWEQKYDISKILGGVSAGELISFLDREKLDLSTQVRNLETAIAALNRQKGTTNCDRVQEKLDQQLSNSIYPFGQCHIDPLDAALQKSAFDYGRKLDQEIYGFSDLPVVLQINVVLDVLSASYPPINAVDAYRFQRLIQVIRNISVDFSDAEQATAYKCLADFATTEYPYETKVVPPAGVSKYDLPRDLIASLEDVWIAGNPERFMTLQDSMSVNGSRVDRDVCAYNIHIGLYEDMQCLLTEFGSAENAVQAEDLARQILELAERSSHSAKGYKTFHPPSKKEVLQALESKGVWVPAYAKHVLWCQAEGTENLKNLFYALHLDLDPWVVSQVISPKQGYASFYNIPTSSNNFQGVYHIPVRVESEEIKNFLSTLERQDDGSATSILVQSPVYVWKKSQQSELAIRAAEREAHEQKLCAEADWSLLATNFKRFVAIHGRNLIPNQSSLPVKYHFAEKFYHEVEQQWLKGDLKFQAAVKEYFGKIVRSIPDRSAYWDTNILERRGQNQLVLLTGELYREEQSCCPTYAQDHPLLRFMQGDVGKAAISDKAKLQILTEMVGFATEDNLNKPLCEIFGRPLDQILSRYPQLSSINDLLAYLDKDLLSQFNHNPEFAGIAFAAEAEKIAIDSRETISVEDLFLLAALNTQAQTQHHYDNPILYANRSLQHIREIGLSATEREFNAAQVQAVIESYRLVQVTRFIRNNPELKIFAQQRIVNELPKLPLEQQVALMQDILRPEDLSLRYNNDPKRSLLLNGRLNYSAKIEEPEFRTWLVDSYSAALVQQVGIDDGSEHQREKIKVAIDQICSNSTGLTKISVLERFADLVNAQEETALYAEERYLAEIANNAKTRDFGVAIGELAINETNRDQKLADQILEFLADSATETNASFLIETLKKKNEALSDVSDHTIFASLENLHKNFWSATLEMRVVYLEKIAFPEGSTAQEQRNKVNDLIMRSFPIDLSSSERSDNWYAHKILEAYFQEADLPEQRLLAAALLAADMRDDDGTDRRVGQKLYTILAHMGPAGAKLLQAIHSHPDVPEHIKNDIADAKVMFDRPKRWEVVRLTKEAGLLDQDRADRVTYIGKVEGAGAFGITTFNRLADGSFVADTLLRRHAADRADREFGMMLRGSVELVNGELPELKPIMHMIHDARESAKIETNMLLAEVANALAVESYNSVKVTVEQDGINYVFEHEVAELIQHGDGFKRSQIAPGIHFNGLPTTTHSERSFKKAVAKAMIAAQLALRLAGKATDRDRHGGNIKVEGQKIHHFDFGSMSLESITSEDHKVTGKIMAEVLADVSDGKPLNTALEARINTANVSDETRKYLNGMRKDLLALGDYMKVLEGEELAAIIASALLAETVHPEIKAAFNAQLGSKAFLVEAVLRSKAKNSGVLVEMTSSS
jgi:hypothetical protein